jgi:hypothetical protein
MPAAVSVYWDAKRVAAKTGLAVSTQPAQILLTTLYGLLQMGRLQPSLATSILGQSQVT